MIGLELDYGGRPINRPIFVRIRPFKAILVEQLLDELHSSILEFVKVADLIMFGHVAYLGECISNTTLSLFAFLVISFLNALDLLGDNIFSLQSGPRFKPQRSSSLSLPHYLHSSLSGIFVFGSGQQDGLTWPLINNRYKLIKLKLTFLFFL